MKAILGNHTHFVCPSSRFISLDVFLGRLFSIIVFSEEPSQVFYLRAPSSRGCVVFCIFLFILFLWYNPYGLEQMDNFTTVCDLAAPGFYFNLFDLCLRFVYITEGECFWNSVWQGSFFCLIFFWFTRVVHASPYVLSGFFFIHLQG